MRVTKTSSTLRYEESPLPDLAAGSVRPGSAPRSTDTPAHRGWDDLYDQAKDAQAYRAAQAQRLEAEREAMRELEKWSQRAVEQVMLDLKRAAEVRCREFRQRTGQEMSVHYPSDRPVPGAGGDPQMRFLKLELGQSQVHVYSSCAFGATTQLHLLPSRRESLQRKHRLVSTPGVFIVRRSDDGYELRSLRGHSSRGAGEPVSIDGLLFQACSLLIAIESGTKQLDGDWQSA